MYFILYLAHINRWVGGIYICTYFFVYICLVTVVGGGAFKNIARRNVNIVHTAREAYFCRIVNFQWTRGGTQNNKANGFHKSKM